MSDADDDLIEQVRFARAAADPPPESLRGKAERALLWDVELAKIAEVTFDSLVGVGDMRDANHDVTPRDLTFAVGDVLMELTVDVDGDQIIIEGLVEGQEVGGPGLTATLLLPGGDPTTAEIDHRGRFRLVATTTSAAIQLDGVASHPVRTPLFSLLS